MLLLAAVGLLWLSWECLAAFLDLGRAPHPPRNTTPPGRAGTRGTPSAHPTAPASSPSPAPSPAPRRSLAPAGGGTALPESAAALARNAVTPPRVARRAWHIPSDLGAGAFSRTPPAGRVWVLIAGGLRGSDLWGYPALAPYRASARTLRLTVESSPTAERLIAAILLGADTDQLGAATAAGDARDRQTPSRESLSSALLAAGDLAARMAAAGISTHVRASNALAHRWESAWGRGYAWERLDPDPALAPGILHRVAADLRADTYPQLGIVQVPLVPWSSRSGARTTATIDVALAAAMQEVRPARARARFEPDDIAFFVIPTQAENGHLDAVAMGSAIRPGRPVRGRLEDLSPTIAWFLGGPRAPLPVGRPLVDLSCLGPGDKVVALYDACLEQRRAWDALELGPGPDPGEVMSPDQILSLYHRGRYDAARHALGIAHAVIAGRMLGEPPATLLADDPESSEGGADRGAGAAATLGATGELAGGTPLVSGSDVATRTGGAIRHSGIPPRLRGPALVIGALGALVAFVFTPRPGALLGAVMWTALGVAIVATVWQSQSGEPAVGSTFAQGPLLWRVLICLASVILVAVVPVGRRGARSMAFILSWFDAIAGVLALSVALIPPVVHVDTATASVSRFLTASLAVIPLVFAPAALLDFMWNRMRP